MKEEVIKFMDETRVLYRADTHLEVLAGRVCLLVSALQDRTTTYSPAVMGLYSFEPVRQLLDRPVDSDPVTAEDVVGTLADVDAVMSHCRQHRVKQMMDLLRQSDDMPVADPTEAHLELATSLFCCQGHQDGSCDNTGVLDAPGMIVHSCWSWFMRERPDRNDWVARSHAEYLTEVCSWVRGAGGAGRFGLDATARARAAHIVSLVGLDPGTATYSDMDAVDPWFLRTDTDQDGRTAANWRQVVSGTSRRTCSVYSSVFPRSLAVTVRSRACSGYFSTTKRRPEQKRKRTPRQRARTPTATGLGCTTGIVSIVRDPT
jgi:hypothetical protein